MRRKAKCTFLPFCNERQNAKMPFVTKGIFMRRKAKCSFLPFVTKGKMQKMPFVMQHLPSVC